MPFTQIARRASRRLRRARPPPGPAGKRCHGNDRYAAAVDGLHHLRGGVFHRRAHEVGLAEAAVWSGVSAALSLVFNLLVYRCIFAILGLRALYFLLAGVMHRFRHLETGLALVLAFIGTKMLLTDVSRIPIGVSLVVVVALLGAAVSRPCS